MVKQFIDPCSIWGDHGDVTGEFSVSVPVNILIVELGYLPTY